MIRSIKTGSALRLSLVVALLCVAAGSNAFANHYGMAGCGLGAVVFKDKPGKIQIVASTLNNLVSPQTSAITSGTSNCTEEASGVAALFININQEAVRKDAARGEGETLRSLARIYGCSDSVDFGPALQKNYSEIFNQSNSPAEMGKRVQETLLNDESIKTSCSHLS
jgi:hypothetical protein